MGDAGLRSVIVLGEKIGHDIPRPQMASMMFPSERTDVERARNELLEVETPADPSLDTDYLFYDPNDSGSEYEDVVAPVQKRKRRTNNSLALDLENGNASISIPPPPKRLHFSVTEKGALVGVWKLCPEPDNAKKHAVFAFIDSNGSLRQKVYPETRDGQELLAGFPTGTGRSFAVPDNVLLDPHLLPLSREEVKEYVRIRCTSQNKNESAEQRSKADALAVTECRKVVANKINLMSSITLSAPSTPSVKRKPSSPSTPMEKVNGVLLGFWKDSDAPRDADKHAIYGVVDGLRLRSKVIKFTRDGRPYLGNLPLNHGSIWQPFESIVLEPALAKLTRTEVREYARLRQERRMNGGPDGFGAGIDSTLIEEAKARVAEEARAKGVDPLELDASLEAYRKAHNISRAAFKSKEDLISAMDTTQEGPKTQLMRVNTQKKEGSFREVTFSQVSRSQQPTSMAAEYRKSTGIELSRAGVAEAVSTPTKIDVPTGKAKAIRSSKAESDARAEKLRKLRESAVQGSLIVKDKGGAKESPTPKSDQVQKVTKLRKPNPATLQLARELGEEGMRAGAEARQALNVRDETQDRMARRENDVAMDRDIASCKAAVKEREVAKEQDEVSRPTGERERKLRLAELTQGQEQKKKDALAKEKHLSEERARMDREEFKDKTAAQVQQGFKELEEGRDKAAEVARKNPLMEDRTQRDPQASEASTMDERPPTPNPSVSTTATGTPQPSTDIKWHNGVKYERKNAGPFAGKLVCTKREVLTIDGEDYVEYRILMRTEF